MKKWKLPALLLAAAVALCPALASAKTLSYGSTGDEVTALQERLTELYYYTFRITGKYQERTEKAVSDFRRSQRSACRSRIPVRPSAMK